MTSSQVLTFKCPEGTRSLSFPYNEDSAIAVNFLFQAEGFSSIANPPVSHNVCFYTALNSNASSFCQSDLSTLGDVVQLCPVALVMLRSKALVSSLPYWPCARKNAYALLCVLWHTDGDTIDCLVLLNYSEIHKCNLAEDFGGLAQTLRTLKQSKPQRKQFSDVYTFEPMLPSNKNTISTINLGVHVAVAVDVAGEVGVDHAMNHVEASASEHDRHLVISKNSVYKLSLPDTTMVLDVAACVRLRAMLEWSSSSSTTTPSTDLGPLAWGPPLETLPESLESESHCYLFVAVIDLLGASSRSCLFVCNGKLRHVGWNCLIAAGARIAAAIRAYRRVCNAQKAVNSKKLTFDGHQYSVQFVVFSHKQKSAPGPLSELEQLHTQWEALLGKSEAGALRDSTDDINILEPGRLPHQRADETCDVSDGDSKCEGIRTVDDQDGTVGHFIAQASSCSNRGLVVTKAMQEALSLGRGGRTSGVFRSVPDGTKIIAPPVCKGDTDTAEIQIWDGLEGCFNSLGESVAHLSSSSVLAWCLGLISEPSSDEYDYTTSIIQKAKDVTMAAVRKRIELMRPDGPAIGGPSITSSTATVDDLDIDLFEAVLQVTSSLCVQRNALRNADSVFFQDADKPNDDSASDALDDDGVDDNDEEDEDEEDDEDEDEDADEDADEDEDDDEQDDVDEV